ncbi:unnamed protein product [Closterium sp. Naga37s-1]|nr:unnamed protein product [Closterium sp. Naga37s-1]
MAAQQVHLDRPAKGHRSHTLSCLPPVFPTPPPPACPPAFLPPESWLRNKYIWIERQKGVMAWTDVNCTTNEPLIATPPPTAAPAPPPPVIHLPSPSLSPPPLLIAAPSPPVMPYLPPTHGSMRPVAPPPPPPSPRPHAPPHPRLYASPTYRASPTRCTSLVPQSTIPGFTPILSPGTLHNSAGSTDVPAALGRLAARTFQPPLGSAVYAGATLRVTFSSMQLSSASMQLNLNAGDPTAAVALAEDRRCALFSLS